MRDEERIRQRAYEIWEREGKPEGREDEHWTQACQEIEAEGGSPPMEAETASGRLGSAADALREVESGTAEDTGTDAAGSDKSRHTSPVAEKTGGPV